MPAPRPIQPDGKLHGVVGAIHRAADDRWLCIRRSQHVAAPGKVCFPGGAIEIGEDHAAALVREMREELGAAVRPIRQCWRWEAPDRPLVLFGWTAELLAEALSPDPMEIAEVLWLGAEEIAGHPDGLPSNRAFVACLLEERSG
jgi:8-oxo-dGTP pyrophosphatase MutT (NUDIX family)